jgi:DNA polymerase-2
MNSFWGVLASPNCRYFNFDMASSITAFARWAIQTTAKKIEEMDYRVIYGDTDSAFIETGLGKEPANQKGKEIEEFINQFYKNYIKEQFRRESFLELQFQKQYLSMMIPKIRSQQKSGEEEKEVAAKKRYAGLIEQKGKEELELVGLEAIRGDWTDAAQEFQRELLLKTFHKEPVEPFIKSYIKKIREGKLDNKLIYKKSIRKALDEYTKTTPPHVKAARLLDSLDSNIIQYYITKAGPEPIQKLKHKIDYEHYIEKQIKPIANQVLFLLGKDFDELSKDHKQATLF